MSVTYHYRRNYTPYSEEIGTLSSALERAKSDIEDDLAAPEKIVLETGEELDRDQILERLPEGEDNEDDFEYGLYDFWYGW